jgi:hypothetical protein
MGVRHVLVTATLMGSLLGSLLASSLVAQQAASPSAGKGKGDGVPLMNIVTDDPFYTTGRTDWPGPNAVRGANGMPGPSYWQQRADYRIAAALDTATQMVTGTVRIRYHNNSPDVLPFVWLQLDQNLYRPDSWGAAINPADSRWGFRGFVGGYTLTNVRVDGRAARYEVSDTRMRLQLDRPMSPRASAITITMGFSFRVPEHGSDRMGRDGTLYEIAQWYPRMAVYDDVRGWNTEPYLGQGEFYLEYGDYDYSVTVPAGYTVAASGVLQNSAQVLSVAQRSRLQKAARSTEVVPIITAEEAAPRAKAGTRTWRFVARNVRDVAWAAAPDFRWDATSTGPMKGAPNGVLCQSYYPLGKTGRAWEAAAEQTQFSIRRYSELVLPYPYPQATSVAGPVGGMEYPMFVMVHYGRPLDDPTSIFRTLDHEHGHQWFPMIVGSNERRYAWMDEGLNTYINAFSMERRYAGTDRATEVLPFYVQNWRDIRARGIESPLMTMPDHVVPGALGAIGYRKPGAVLLTLRNHVIGKQVFDSAFKAYARAWAFKHPTPGDFFRAIESYAGADLSWYWRNFFYTNAVLDVGIETVRHQGSGEDRSAIVTLRNVTNVPFPVMLRVRHASGKVADIRLPVDIWAGTTTFEAAIPAGADDVVGARLWPDPSVPDWDSTNDSWGNAPPQEPKRPVTD